MRIMLRSSSTIKREDIFDFPERFTGLNHDFFYASCHRSVLFAGWFPLAQFPASALRNFPMPAEMRRTLGQSEFLSVHWAPSRSTVAINSLLEIGFVT